MTETIHYSVADKHLPKLKSVHRQWQKRNCSVSAKTVEAQIFLYEHEEKDTKITNFLKYETSMDMLPRMWEQLTKDDLKKLDARDLGRLRKNLAYNLGVINDYCDTLDRLERIKRLEQAVIK